jgi:peptide-methionine (R)-S-oxide reductase
MPTRRHLLFAGTGALAVVLIGRLRPTSAEPVAKVYEVTHSDAEWKNLLTADQYAVLRHEGTERPFTSPLLHEERVGQFTCAGCDKPLFLSKTKFDSHTGWPSFWDAMDAAVDKIQDRSYGMTRTAIACERCGGHLGHVFPDGPKPTGLRYCMNGVALKFVPDAA